MQPSKLRWLCAVACAHGKGGFARQGAEKSEADLIPRYFHKKSLSCAAFKHNASMCVETIIRGMRCVHEQGTCKWSGISALHARQHPQPWAVDNVNQSTPMRRDCSALNHNGSLCVKRYFRGHRCVYDEGKGKCRVPLTHHYLRHTAKRAVDAFSQPPAATRVAAQAKAKVRQRMLAPTELASSGVRPQSNHTPHGRFSGRVARRTAKSRRQIRTAPADTGTASVYASGGTATMITARSSHASKRNARLGNTEAGAKPLGEIKAGAKVMTLHEQVDMLKRELGVSGTFIEVVRRSARNLGIKSEGMPLRQLAARCMEVLGT